MRQRHDAMGEARSAAAPLLLGTAAPLRADTGARRGGGSAAGRRVSPTRVRLRELSPPTDAQAGGGAGAHGAVAMGGAPTTSDELLRLRYLHHLTTQIKLSNVVRCVPGPGRMRGARATRRTAASACRQRRQSTRISPEHGVFVRVAPR
jgi:hypothetical protein